MAALSVLVRPKCGQRSWATKPVLHRLSTVKSVLTSDYLRPVTPSVSVHGGCRGGNLPLVLALSPGSEPHDHGHARRRPGGAEADHRPSPRPLAHAAQLGRLEATLRVEGPHSARTGLAGTRGNGGGGSPQYLQVRAARDQGDH